MGMYLLYKIIYMLRIMDIAQCVNMINNNS